MKKKIYIGLLLFATFVFIGLASLKSEPVKADYCEWGYKSTTAWPGNCINCFCDTWDHPGAEGCPPPPP